MSHADAPHREPPRDSEPSSSRDQRIEQLLLTGLDRYFAGELERAIQVWSRVFFLDRGHPRARAYIERARGAIAERQREAEAHVHRGEVPSSVLLDVSDMTLRPELADVPGLDALQSRPPIAVASSSQGVSSAAAAFAACAPLDVEDAVLSQAAPAPHMAAGEEGPGRSRAIAHVLLVALAALLLFGAGYVVAARDRLAGWWAPPGEPALAVPAMAPESGASARPHDPAAGSSAPPRGTATR
jgi:hypothetical protein